MATLGWDEEQIMDSRNGILLRVDVHRLFDSPSRLLFFQARDDRVFLQFDSSVSYLGLRNDTEVTNFPSSSIQFLNQRE